MSVDHIDGFWFQQLEPVLSGSAQFQGLNEIEGTLRAPLAKREVAWEAFQSGVVNPDLTPEVDLTKLGNSRDELASIRETMGEFADTTLQDAYFPRIDEMEANADMIEGAATGNLELFMEGNLARFGEPDPNTFHNSMAVARKVAEDVADSSTNTWARQEARSLLADTSQFDEMQEPQTPEQFEKVKALFAPVIDEISSVIGEMPANLTGAQAIPLMQRVVDHFGFGYNVVPQKPGLSTMAVDHASQEIRIPEQKVYEDPLYYLGLNIHEVWIHVNEAIQGAEQPLLLVKRGLDRFLFAGEGKGLVAEEVVYPRYQDFLLTPRSLEIVRRQLAIGTGRGLLHGDHANFKEVYDTVNRLDRLLAFRAGHTDQVAASTVAGRNSWELLSMRTQKGVTGVGAASVQDKVYGEGSGPQMRFLAEHPEAFPYLNLGKYNLLDPKHIAILKKIGTLPASLML